MQQVWEHGGVLQEDEEDIRGVVAVGVRGDGVVQGMLG